MALSYTFHAFQASEAIRNFLNRLFLVMPQHALSDGMVALCENYILAEVFERYYINTYQSPLTSTLLLPHLLSLFVFGLVFIVINYTIESGIMYSFWHRVHRKIKGERYVKHVFCLVLMIHQQL